MAKLNPDHFPELKKAWDDYGHSIKFEDLFDYRRRSDGYYIVVAWKVGDQIHCADLYRTRDTEWEFQNDGFDPITEGQWDRVKIVPDCDYFDYPSEEEMVDILHEERVGKDKKYAAAFAIYEEGYQDAYGNDNLVEKWLASYSYTKNFKK
jgi:hypothetical protein